MSLDILVSEAEVAAARDGLSPRSPGFGAGSAPRVPPADPVETLRRGARRPRREAVMGRASAGVVGDGDAPDSGVAESAAMERLDRALQLRETVMRAAREHEEVHGHRAPQADVMLAMANREVARAEAAAGLSESAGADDGGLREAIPGLDVILSGMVAEQWEREKSPHDVLREDQLPGLEDMLAEMRLDRQEREGSGPYAGDGAFRTFLRESGDDIDDGTIYEMVREGTTE